MKLSRMMAAAVIVVGLATTALAAPLQQEDTKPGDPAPASITAKFHDGLKQAAAGLPIGSGQADAGGQVTSSAFDHRQTYSAGQAKGATTESVGADTVSACSIAARVEYYNNDGSLHVYDVSCSGQSPPKPSKIEIKWWEASLADWNTTPRLVQTTTVNCGWLNNYCLGMDRWFDSHRVTGTSAIFPTYHLVDVRGNSHDDQYPPWFYNDNGYPYPMFTDTRWGGRTLVPFRIPNLGWNVCEDTGAPGACDRPSWFRSALIDWYNRVHWSYQTSWEAHHIAPLSLGGGSNHLDENGVLIASNLHDVYTYKFWPAFRPRRW